MAKRVWNISGNLSSRQWESAYFRGQINFSTVFGGVIIFPGLAVSCRHIFHRCPSWKNGSTLNCFLREKARTAPRTNPFFLPLALLTRDVGKLDLCYSSLLSSTLFRWHFKSHTSVNILKWIATFISILNVLSKKKRLIDARSKVKKLCMPSFYLRTVFLLRYIFASLLYQIPTTSSFKPSLIRSFFHFWLVIVNILKLLLILSRGREIAPLE